MTCSFERSILYLLRTTLTAVIPGMSLRGKQTMITLITALYPEAKPLIQMLKLKQNPAESRYAMFEQENIRLIITGSGMIPAAACVAGHFTKYPPAACDLVVNIGIAGYCTKTLQADSQTLIGRLFLALKITEYMTGRTFYPDFLYRENFDKLPLTTVPLPATAASLFAEDTLIDMEGSALYQALLPFFSPERMFFFKVISDVLGCEQNCKITPALTEQWIGAHTAAILSFVTGIEKHLISLALPSYTPEELALTETLYERLPLTESTRKEVARLFTYAKLTRTDLAPVIREYLDSFPTEPVRGKKQAAPHLKRLQEHILSHAPFTTDSEISSGRDGYHPFYHTVYAEKSCLAEFFNELSDAKDSQTLIEIDHYKDVFNRSRQNFAEQKKAPSLILAKKTGTLIYPGAPVCQSFGNEHFYYTSCMMNCIYHCDYCYLQGMYPSGHTVVFVNLDDYFAELTGLLKEHPVYLCISYDTDLLALEQRFGFVRRWLTFAASHENLTLEIRTKSGNPAIFHTLAPLATKRVIFAWTVSPDSVIASTEHGSASLPLRLAALRAARDAGFSVRLCFDPMIFYADWKEGYHALVETVFREIRPKDLYDVSIGVFRISTDYLKNMRKKRPDSAIVQFPYITENGVSHYGELSHEMVNYLKELLLPYLPADKIFLWNGGT